jgi:hypothetical protein
VKGNGHGGVRRVTPQRRCRPGAGVIHSRSRVFTSLFLMFNFSANHLLLLSRMEYRTCVVFLMKDDSTRRVYRLYDFTKSQIITSDHYYCVSGKVNSADKLYLVIESVKRDTNTARIRSYAWSGRRGRSAHELEIADRQKARIVTACF